MEYYTVLGMIVVALIAVVGFFISIRKISRMKLTDA